MRLRVAAVMGLAAGLVGCSNDSGEAGAGPPQDKAWVRFGNLSPDTPAIDICAKPSSSTSWGSPILAANGLPGGLTFPAMSKVIYIAPGTLDFRAVTPGGDCSALVGIDLTAQDLNPHGTYTITALGLLAPGAQPAYLLQQYIEHQESPDAGFARMRFINVIPNSPPIYDGLTDGGVWDVQFSEAEMPFRKNASGATLGLIDGYMDMPPNPALPLTIRATPPQTNPDLYVAPINLRAGIITAVWAVGLLGGTGNERLSYYVCDETPAAKGGQTSCNRE
jgi:hypothetical protein